MWYMAITQRDSSVYVFNYENVRKVGSYETDALGSGGNLVGYG
jgi:hypothetical protein